MSVATAVVTYALVVLGGVVRVSGSGLGCPDWPLCHGRLLPPLDLHAIIEYSHRTAASLTSTLVVLTAAVAWMAWRNRRDLVVPATLAVSLLAVQVVLGAITVRLELPPMIVLAHLATAMALLALLLFVALRSSLPTARRRTGSGLTAWLGIAAAAVFVLMLLGSHVTATAVALSARRPRPS